MTVEVRQIRFPTIVRYGLVAGPRREIQRVITGGGFVFKNSQWDQPLRKFQADTANLTFDQWEALNAFILAGSEGPLYNFRLLDHTDYQAFTEPFGTGDGVEDTFQLRKTYTTGAYSKVRDITQPHGNIAGDTAPQIFKNGVAESASNYTIDYTTGIVTFGGAHIPEDDAELTWTGQFDVPCEFVEDYQPATYEDFEMVNGRSWPIDEVRVA